MKYYMEKNFIAESTIDVDYEHEQPRFLFHKAIVELMEACDSVGAAVEHSKKMTGIKFDSSIPNTFLSDAAYNCLWDYDDYLVTEEKVTSLLAANVITDRPTNNGEDWGKCSILVSATGMRCTTRSGLSFGWEVSTCDVCSYTFYVQHPALADENLSEGEIIKKLSDSSLYARLKGIGYKEVPYKKS